MTSPEVFADAVAARCEAALSRIRARVERFSIGAMSIKLVAPCDEAIRIGFFSLKLAKYPPSPRLSDTSVNDTQNAL